MSMIRHAPSPMTPSAIAAAPRNRERAALTALAECPRCRSLTPDAKAARVQEILEDVRRAQSRALSPLPVNVWPNRRPPLATVGGWTLIPDEPR